MVMASEVGRTNRAQQIAGLAENEQEHAISLENTAEPLLFDLHIESQINLSSCFDVRLLGFDVQIQAVVVVGNIKSKSPDSKQNMSFNDRHGFRIVTPAEDSPPLSGLEMQVRRPA